MKEAAIFTNKTKQLNILAQKQEELQVDIVWKKH